MPCTNVFELGTSTVGYFDPRIVFGWDTAFGSLARKPGNVLTPLVDKWRMHVEICICCRCICWAAAHSMIGRYRSESDAEMDWSIKKTNDRVSKRRWCYCAVQTTKI